MAGLVPAIHVLLLSDQIVQVVPFRIASQYQSYFPFARPVLDVVFALNRGLDFVVVFEVDQALERIALGESSDNSVPVFVDAPDKVVCHADVQNAVRCTRHQVHVTAAHAAIVEDVDIRCKPGHDRRCEEPRVVGASMTEDVDGRDKPGHDDGVESWRTCRHQRSDNQLAVMAGLVPAIHVLPPPARTWMPGTRPGMTVMEWCVRDNFFASIFPHYPSWPGLSRPSTFLSPAPDGPAQGPVPVSAAASCPASTRSIQSPQQTNFARAGNIGASAWQGTERGGMDGFECDVLVVGSGCAGISAAITAAHRGLKVMIAEKEPRFGGTTARSGGWLWIPGTSLAQSLGHRRGHGAGAHLSAP